MSYDKRITDIAAEAAMAAGKNAEVAPQLLLADITFALADAVEKGRLILGLSDEDSSLVIFARTELDRVGGIYDGMVNEAALAIVAVFASQGHSGGSAQLTTEIVDRLMRFEPLSPLTGDDDEWNEVGDNSWQNRRCPSVFKDEARAWDIELPRTGGAWQTIEFPYLPGRALADA